MPELPEFEQRPLRCEAKLADLEWGGEFETRNTPQVLTRSHRTASIRWNNRLRGRDTCPCGPGSGGSGSAGGNFAK